jgi:hypothetical protein
VDLPMPGIPTEIITFLDLNGQEVMALGDAYSLLLI